MDAFFEVAADHRGFAFSGLAIEVIVPHVATGGAFVGRGFRIAGPPLAVLFGTDR